MTFDPKCIYCQSNNYWGHMAQPLDDYGFVRTVVQHEILMDDMNKLKKDTERQIQESKSNLERMSRSDPMPPRHLSPDKRVDRSRSAPDSLESMKAPVKSNSSEIPNSCCAWIKYPFIKILDCIRKILCAIWGLCGHEEE